jgi:hypothetical protein
VRRYRFFTGREVTVNRHAIQSGASETPNTKEHEMNAPLPGNPLWQEHLEWVRVLHGDPATISTETQRVVTSDRQVEEIQHGEWTARPPGRLARRLIAEIETYLEFFAIAWTD